MKKSRNEEIIKMIIKKIMNTIIRKILKLIYFYMFSNTLINLIFEKNVKYNL